MNAKPNIRTVANIVHQCDRHAFSNWARILIGPKFD
jgi:hypothetical protein